MVVVCWSFHSDCAEAIFLMSCLIGVMISIGWFLGCVLALFLFFVMISTWVLGVFFLWIVYKSIFIEVRTILVLW